jgi:hypothetical protein
LVPVNPGSIMENDDKHINRKNPNDHSSNRKIPGKPPIPNKISIIIQLKTLAI